MAPEHVPSLRGRATIITVIVVVILIALCLVVWVYRDTPPLSTLLGAGQNQPRNGAQATATYLCNQGKMVKAAYYTDSVELTLNDGTAMTLPHAMSASGARYANSDETFVFWNKGNTAFIEENGTQTYTGCIAESERTAQQNSWNAYASSEFGFSILFPMDYTANTSYKYEALGPGKTINGVKFTIPPSMASSTNLSSDTYISVERLPNAATCSAAQFIDGANTVSTTTEDGTEYSVAKGGGAGAGNLYEETVYAIPGTMPCIAVRYFIHSTQLANYPAGTRTQFDKAALVAQFDEIRKTLVLGR